MNKPVMYYSLYTIHEDPDGLFGIKYDLAGVDEYFPTSTSPATNWPANIRFYTEGTIPLDHLPCVPAWSLVSERVKDVLEELDREAVECLPVQVFRLETGESVPGYYVLHVLREVAAFDREHGTYNMYGERLQVMKVALRREAVKGLHLFRLAEANRQPYVSKEVVKRLKAIGATGFTWLPVRAY